MTEKIMTKTGSSGIRRHTRRDVLRYGGIGAAVLGAGQLFGAGPSLAQPYSVRGFTTPSTQSAVEAAVQRFIDRYPGSDVAFEFAATDQLQTTTRVQLGSGTGPDLVTVWPGSGNPLAVGQLAPNNLLLDLSDRPWASQMPAGLHEVLLVDGKHWFLSMQTSMIGGLVNERVWNDLGLGTPTTWSEFVDTCQTIKDAGLVPISIGASDAWTTQIINYALVASIIYADNPDFDAEMQAGSTRFADSGWVEAMTKFAELHERGFFNANPNGTPNSEQLQMVAAGQAAMTFTTSNQVPALLGFADHEDFWLLPLNGTDDPDKLRIPASASSGLGVNANAANPEGAIAFLDFLAEPEQVTEWGMSGVATLLPGAPSKWDELYEDATPLLRSGKSVIYMDNRWPNARVQQAHLAGVQELLSGQSTIDEVLSRMDEAYAQG